jgi:exonuclease VII small subunit
LQSISYCFFTISDTAEPGSGLTKHKTKNNKVNIYKIIFVLYQIQIAKFHLSCNLMHMSKQTQKNKDKQSLSASLAELRKIVAWFEDNEDVDLEEGIKKVKEGAIHLKAAREHLKEIDNEFKEVEKLLE